MTIMGSSDPFEADEQGGDSRISSGFRFLDSDADRKALAEDVHRVRAAVLKIVQALPVELHDQPRYHGWTPDAMLAHLHSVDGFALLLIQLGLIGIPLPFPTSLVDPLNKLLATVFRRRVLATTAHDIEKRERRIVELILTLPMSRFSRRVYYPARSEYLTVEQALQAYFLHHWVEHLETMAATDGVTIPPFAFGQRDAPSGSSLHGDA